MAETTDNAPVLLYDGECGLCDSAVQLILRHDTRGLMRFAPLQSEYGRAALARHPVLAAVDSVVLLERDSVGAERAYVRSDAALRVAAYLGGLWKLLLPLRVVPKPVRDFAYDLLARNRYRFFGRHESCLLPAPEVRTRFIDL